MSNKSSITYLRHAASAYRVQMCANIALGVADVIIGLAEVWLTKQLIDAAVAGRSWTMADGGWLSLPVLAGMLLACMLTSVALAYAVRWLRAKLSVRSLNRLQAGEYARLLQSPWLYLRKQHSGTLTNTLIEDIDTISAFLSEQLPAFVTAILQFVGAFAFLCVLDWRLAIVIIVVTPALIAAAQLYIRRMRRHRHQVREDQASIQAFIQESIQHSLLLKALNRSAYASALLDERHEGYRQSYMRLTRYSAMAMVLVRTAFVAGYLIAFFWGAYSLSVHAITFGAMIAFVQLVGRIQQPMRTLIGYVGTFVNVGTSAERIAAISGQQSVVSSQQSAISGQAPEIKVRDLSFTYPDSDEPVLSHLDADIPAGSLTAVVGKTGIGKTTFVQLLLGLLPVEEGSISAPNQGFAYVPQGNTLLSGTIRYNLLFGNPAASDEAMREALRLADAEFVLDDERGLDYPCGERGSGLSEGQAQRIAIARALLIDAPVLMLDEAFSALDTPTAQVILDNIRRARPEQTIICITHRESLLPQADQVIQLA
jgi:ABC-type multidrug transport system, ATPase and permease components